MKTIDTMYAKMLSSFDITLTAESWRAQGKKIVFTNGCFDLLHFGHIHYLCQAADLGDLLIVGLNTDRSVRSIKGANRPINDEKNRQALLAALSFVDAVVLFDEDTPYNLISLVKPDILVKASDYKKEDVVGYDIVTATGGEVITLDYLGGYSSTSIEQKIKGQGLRS